MVPKCVPLLAGSMLALVMAFFAVPSAQGAIVMGSKDLGAIWCIGDSIMQSNADNSDISSPRKSLYDKLKAGGYTFSFTGHSTENIDGLPNDVNYTSHSGMSGFEIAQANGGIPSWWDQGRLDTVKPNVIVIMLGTNDVNNNIPSGASGRMTTLLNTIYSIYSLEDIGNPTVILSTIPPILTTNDVSAADHFNQVVAFNTALAGVVSTFSGAGKDIYLSDVFTGLNANYATAMLGDNLHTNALGNNILGQNWYQTINTVAVPEPSTIGLLALGGLAVVVRRRRHSGTKSSKM